MKCDICDMPAVINDLCQGCYDDLAKGGDDALRAAEMFQLRIADIKIESNKLHDALERNRQMAAAYRRSIGRCNRCGCQYPANILAGPVDCGRLCLGNLPT